MLEALLELVESLLFEALPLESLDEEAFLSLEPEDELSEELLAEDFSPLFSDPEPDPESEEPEP